MVRTQIQLTEEQAVMLKKMAIKQRKSIAALIRQAIDRMVLTGADKDKQMNRGRAMAAAGRFHSGIHDLSANHDQYFVEAIKG